MEDELVFTKRMHCAGCGQPIDPGETWGCVRGLIPVAAPIPMEMYIHHHLHLRCSSGEIKWEILAANGHYQRGLN